MSLHTEIHLERDICDHLGAHGWLYSAPGTEGLAGILHEFLRRQQALLKDRVRGQFVSVVRGDLVHPQDVLERLHPNGNTEEEVFG